tara:strand:- start:2074 stop:2418 length:345 start_codon:yes stop_codon:yes gene_type:complete
MTVYIVQEMRGRDITDAASFGNLEILLPAKEQVSFSTQPTVRRMAAVLSKFTDDDYLLLGGDPAGVAIAASLAAQYNRGRYKLLKWDRLEKQYFPLQVDILQRTSPEPTGEPSE